MNDVEGCVLAIVNPRPDARAQAGIAGNCLYCGTLLFHLGSGRTHFMNAFTL